MAATPNVKMLLVAACPCVCPAVATDNVPRLVFRCRKRAAAPVFFTITMRGLAVLLLICSYGSSLPFWMFVELAATVVPAVFSRKMS